MARLASLRNSDDVLPMKKVLLDVEMRSPLIWSPGLVIQITNGM
jgi:hypothetical protein